MAAKGLLDAALDSAASQSKRLARAKRQDFNVDLPLYHGTSKEFKGFKKSNLGSLTGSRSAKKAFWMSDDPTTANTYAHHSAIRGPVQDLIRKSEEAEQKGNFDKSDDLLDEAEQLEKVLQKERLAGQNIIPVYAKNDLLEIDMEGRSFDDWGVSDEIEFALDSAKHDGRAGVKFLNLNDAVGLSVAPSTHVAVFEPNNIRSVNAKFDPRRKSSTNLLASPAPVTIGAGLLGNAAVQRFNEGVLGGADFLANAGSAFAEPFISAALTLQQLAPGGLSTDEIEARRAQAQNSLDYQPRTEIGRNATESALGLLGGALQGPMAAGKAIAEPLIPIYDAAAEQYKRLPRRVQLGAESLLDTF